MFTSSLGMPGGHGFRGFGLPQQRSSGRSGPRKIKASAGSAAAPSEPAGGLLSNPVLKAGLISGSLSLAGDLIAQLLAARGSGSGLSGASYDAARAARMGSFGLCFYGPYQHYWYRALDAAFTARNVPNFLAKVTLNQLCLAPVVIATVFAWNLGLQGKLAEWPSKAKRDFVPTLIAGWRFWIPAASINFLAVPLRHQVLYMSTCGVVWTAILSASSAKAEAAAAAGAKGGKGKKK